MTTPSRTAGATTAAVTSSTTAFLACGACCILPLMLPTAMVAASGGVLGWFSKAQPWLAGVAALIVLGAWLWLWRAAAQTHRRPNRVTLALMTGSTVMLVVSIAWPWIEPPVLHSLGLE